VRKNACRIITGLVCLTTTAMASVLTGDPALAASGGGCRDTSNNGWSIGSCVSENGGWAWPDFYVNRLGTDVDSAECQMELMDAWGDPISSSWWYCEEVGHYGPDRVLIRKGVHYYNKVTVWTSFRRVVTATAWSPQLTG
jgi:hypothetical protein